MAENTELENKETVTVDEVVIDTPEPKVEATFAQKIEEANPSEIEAIVDEALEEIVLNAPIIEAKMSRLKKAESVAALRKVKIVFAAMRSKLGEDVKVDLAPTNHKPIVERKVEEPKPKPKGYAPIFGK